jgi:hypothetical protein
MRRRNLDHSARLLKLGTMSRDKLPEQVRKLSPTSQDSGAPRVALSGWRASPRRSIECRSERFAEDPHKNERWKGGVIEPEPVETNSRYGKGKEDRKDEAMIARFDHRPMLTAALALSTTVLLVVVVTLSTLLITLPQAASPPSLSDGGNPAGPAPKVMDAESYGEVYGWDIHNK